MRPGDEVPGVPGALVDRLLKDDRYATTARVTLEDGTPAVYKRSVVIVPPGLRVGPAARRLADREADFLARLGDLHGVPALLGRPAPDSLLRRWIDGSTIRELAELPDRVFPDLKALLAQVHARGVAYADLAKEENVVVEEGGDDAGRPWLVDFQISVAAPSPLSALVPRLQEADRYHLARHVKRRRPDQLDDEDRRLLARGRGALSRLHRTLLKKPYNLLTRRIVRRWSGAGEGRREGEPRGLRNRE